jgi:serine/threonine protein kinase
VPTGVGLFDRISHEPMSPAETTTLVRDIASVLAYAHQRGIVHGALALRSVVLAQGERAFPLCILDWGMRTGDLGLFDAPERDKGSCDGRADVYSLGVIAYRAVSGVFPHGPVTDVPNAPAGLATLIARMLARDPDERPTSAEVRALASELRTSKEHDVVATSLATGSALIAVQPELMSFADEESLGDDVVLATPRFGAPKWTPAPPFTITSEAASTAAGEIAEKKPSS